MGTAFATVSDMTALFRPLTPAEQTKAESLLQMVSDLLRVEAMNVGRDIDLMIAQDGSGAYENVVRGVTVDVTARVLMTPTNETPMSQMSQSALGYSVSGTYLVPGGGIFVKKAELARLGLRRQRAGVIRLD